MHHISQCDLHEHRSPGQKSSGQDPAHEGTEGIFKEFLDSLAAELTRCPGDSFHLIFSEQTDEILSRTALEPADLADFKELGKYLGYLDRGMQLSNLDLYLSEAEGKIERLTEELPARKKLFQTMGVLAGVFLAILFI